MCTVYSGASLQYWEDLREGCRRVDDDAERDRPILRSCGRARSQAQLTGF